MLEDNWKPRAVRGLAAVVMTATMSPSTCCVPAAASAALHIVASLVPAPTLHFRGPMRTLRPRSCSSEGWSQVQLNLAPAWCPFAPPALCPPSGAPLLRLTSLPSYLSQTTNPELASHWEQGGPQGESAYPPAPSTGHGPAGCWRVPFFGGEEGAKPLSLRPVMWPSRINPSVLVRSCGWLFLPHPHRPVRLSCREAQAGQREARTQPLFQGLSGLQVPSGLVP